MTVESFTNSPLATVPWWGIFITLAILAMRQRPIMAKLNMAHEQTLLEGRAADNRALAKRVRRLELTMEMKDKIHEAELSLDRHRFVNVNMCFDTLLMMLRQDPSRVEVALQHIEEMRARQMEAEAIEKTRVHEIRVKALAALNRVEEVDEELSED